MLITGCEHDCKSREEASALIQVKDGGDISKGDRSKQAENVQILKVEPIGFSKWSKMGLREKGES